MKKTNKTLAAAAALGLLAACGGTKTVYVDGTEPPDTTIKVVKTTDAPIATPAPALSDEDMFLLGIELTYDGYIAVDDDTLIEVGYATCVALDSGASLDEIAAMAVSSANGSDMILDLFASLTASAVFNFCPEYSWMFE